MRRLLQMLSLTAVYCTVAATTAPLLAQDSAAPAAAPQVGLIFRDPRACPGYTLIAPMTSQETYLIDLEGRVVHTWRSDWPPGLGACLLESGHLLRCGAMSPGEQPFGGPGAAARIQEFNWDGELVWDYEFTLDRQLPHHDVTRLPNGNCLLYTSDAADEL